MKQLAFLLLLLPFGAFAQDQADEQAAIQTFMQSSAIESWLNVQDSIHQRFEGITWEKLLISFLIIFFTFVLRKFLAHWVFATLRKLASKTKLDWDDKILECMERPLAAFIVVIGIFIAFLQLPLSQEVNSFVTKIFNAATIVLIFWAVLRITDTASEVLQEISTRRGHSLGTFVPLINKSLRVFIAILGIALCLENFGLNLGAVLGAIGIGGAAFAFAAKDTIANLYGSFALALDRPFKVGDWIQVGDVVDGNVEEIGLRSTKVRTWPKTVMSIPNNVLANEIINNWSRMPKRRVKQYVGVTYESTPEQMDALVDDIRKILREDEGVNQDFILVNFTDFGSSSLDILVYYFTQSTQWLEYMDIRQRINTKIMRAIDNHGMSIAFPSRTVYLKTDNENELPNDAGAMTPP